jgi:hypothetical protein
MFNASMSSARHSARRVLENVGVYLLKSLDERANHSYVRDISDAVGLVVGLSNVLFNEEFPKEIKRA